ncbi:MAG: ABC transporter permease [Candidatus Omnitrophica bacterium]|nr:ABC transporter permease [Candidatus Omnitrophota bacterium]
MMKKINDIAFSQSFAIQRQVIGALLMREILTRYGRHNIGFLWLFVEPMVFTVGVTALWSILKANSFHGLDIPITAFAVTGYSSVLMWRNTVSYVSHSLTPNLSLLHHRNVRVIDVYFSRILLEITGVTISFVFLSLFFTIVGWMRLPEDMFKVIVGWFMLAWFGSSLSLVVGTLSERSELVEKIWHPLSYLLFPLSGAAFMVDWLPPAAQKIILLLPMVHGLELLREGFFGVNVVRTYYDIPYMAFVCLCLTFAGLAMIRDVVKNIGQE